MKKQIHIMDSVDILDRIDILLFQHAPGHFNLDFECKEKGMRFTMDTDKLKQMERDVVQICQSRGFKADHENTNGWIKEFVGRFVQQAHKMGYCVIEPIPEAIDDHYAHLRNTPQRKD